jgi:hypothetical protein
MVIPNAANNRRNHECEGLCSSTTEGDFSSAAALHKGLASAGLPPFREASCQRAPSHSDVQKPARESSREYLIDAWDLLMERSFSSLMVVFASQISSHTQHGPLKIPWHMVMTVHMSCPAVEN